MTMHIRLDMAEGRGFVRIDTPMDITPEELHTVADWVHAFADKESAAIAGGSVGAVVRNRTTGAILWVDLKPNAGRADERPYPDA